MDSFKNYYTVLNVLETASHQEIKMAFRRMARLYAPDMNPDPSAVRHFEDVLEAWRVLGNPEMRWQYDRSRGLWNHNEDLLRPTVKQPDPEPEPAFSATYVPEKEKSFEGCTPPRRTSQRWEPDIEVEEYFDRPKVVLLVVASTFLIGLLGWPRLSHLWSGRGILKVLVLSAVFTPCFWLTLWGLRFRIDAEWVQNKLRPEFFLPWILGFVYAFGARWFLADVRTDPLLSPLLDWFLWYLSFALVLCPVSLALEPAKESI